MRARKISELLATVSCSPHWLLHGIKRIVLRKSTSGLYGTQPRRREWRILERAMAHEAEQPRLLCGFLCVDLDVPTVGLFGRDAIRVTDHLVPSYERLLFRSRLLAEENPRSASRVQSSLPRRCRKTRPIRPAAGCRGVPEALLR